MCICFLVGYPAETIEIGLPAYRFLINKSDCLIHTQVMPLSWDAWERHINMNYFIIIQIPVFLYV